MNIDRLCPSCMNDNGGEKICGVCGYDQSSNNENFCLPVKFFLSERYVIGSAVSVSPEGITYIAFDTASNSSVHIKEYYPKGISVRNPDKTVSVLPGSEFSFNEGLIDFLEINKKLIASELQAIVPVLTVFEENGTVYAVTPIIQGITLSNFLDRNGGSLRWEQVRPLFLPLIDTIKGLNDIGIVHGGISPETIIVGRDGKLRLGGICIPQFRMASDNKLVELYSGYAAAEQYGKLETGLSAASDVYALSAVLFRAIIGVTPPSAESRLTTDALSIPARFADELPRQVLVAIANGMQVRVQNRTETMDLFKNELVYGETRENMRRAANTHTVEKKAEQQEKKSKNSGMKYAVISASITAAVFLLIAGILCFTIFKDQLFGTDEVGFVNSEFESTPQIESIGDRDPNAQDSTILYKVPDLTGMYYHELEEIENYERFKFSIKGKEYSDKFERGKICEQSVAVNSAVKNETAIQVVISLGPKEVKIKDVIGFDENGAIMELLKQGFLYENIEIVHREDPNKEPETVIGQFPEAGEKVTLESFVRIEINDYKPPEPEEETTEDSSDSSDSGDDSEDEYRH